MFFPGSADYWEKRYSRGGNSGSGSYNRLAAFKSEIVNRFVIEKDIKTVIELGCGDGFQLQSASYPRYVGLDVSVTAVNKCKEMYRDDPSKSFYVYDSAMIHGGNPEYRAELALSLDVVYHLVEDSVLEGYLADLFTAGEKYVIIYSSNEDLPWDYHVKHRRFLPWVEERFPDWELEEVVENRYKYDPADPDNTSRANFYFFKKKLAE